MIQIVSQTGDHQYDAEGRAITTWDNKKCSWIVNPEFASEKIDWYGENSDFPAGYTEEEYNNMYPNWETKPNITVTWTWNTKETCIKVFGLPHTFGEKSDYWDKIHYPNTATRDWGYLEYDEKQAIEQLGKYCNFHTHADKVTVTYNGKIIHEGKLV